MENETGEKSFDVMKWLRETRDRIYEETRDMTSEERRRRLEEMVRNDPFFSKLPRSRIVKPRPRVTADGGRGEVGATIG